jgi:hypothetical protein
MKNAQEEHQNITFSVIILFLDNAGLAEALSLEGSGAGLGPVDPWNSLMG